MRLQLRPIRSIRGSVQPLIETVQAPRMVCVALFLTQIILKCTDIEHFSVGVSIHVRACNRPSRFHPEL